MDSLPIDRASLEQQTVKKLQELLGQRKLKKSGRKAELISRLLGEETAPLTVQKKSKPPRWGSKSCKGKPLLEWMIMNGRDLYADGHLKGQEVPGDVIHESCEEFRIYDKSNFKTNLRSLRDYVKAKKAKAQEEKDAYERQIAKIPQVQFHVKGVGTEQQIYPRWKGHVAQHLLRHDIKQGALDHTFPADDSHTWYSCESPIERMTPKKLWHSRPVYRLWPLKVFRDHIAQEIKSIKQDEWNRRNKVYGYVPPGADLIEDYK